jgi:PST family polysaccharide transporter/lipopolysaccharide exporter
MIHPYRPHLRFYATRAKELSNFGLWIWAVAFIGFIATQLDKVIAGKLLGIEMLGFYVLASRFGDIIALDMGRMTGMISFPAFAKLQDSPKKLREGFYTNLELLLFMVLPPTMILILLSPEFVPLFLGERWNPIVEVLQLLTAGGFIQCMMTQGTILLRALGKPQNEFQIILLRAIVVPVLAILMGRTWGLIGVAGASLIGTGLMLPIWWRLSTAASGLTGKELARAGGPVFLGAALMILVIWGIKQVSSAHALTIVGGLTFGLGAYLIPSWMVWRYRRSGPLARIFNLIETSLK